MPRTCKILLSYFFVVFLFSFANVCFAVNLEVNYPIIQGQTITSQTSVPAYLKYIFDFGMFVGFFAVFLSLAYAGVLYFLSPAIPNALAMAKDRVAGAISGLLILSTAYLIITTINPGLSVFRVPELSKISEPLPASPQAGVMFYKVNNCPAPDPGLNTASIPNLQELNKNVKSVKIIQNPADDIYFISILYDWPNFIGKCQYVDPTIGCHPNIEPFATSVSINKYSKTANGSVTFYRNSLFNPNGGYFTLQSSDIQQAYNNQQLYTLNFETVSFMGPNGCTVPKEEQDCIMWNEKNVCLKRECPTLAGKNIGSIQINGDYLVLLVYFSPTDKSPGPWSFCQAFPAPGDVNQEGPRQIKWEEITNNDLRKLPNWVLIFPLEK